MLLQNLISDDYMAVNFENKVSTKENEIATAKSDAMPGMCYGRGRNPRSDVWRLCGRSLAVISAQGRKATGSSFRSQKSGSWQH